MKLLITYIFIVFLTISCDNHITYQNGTKLIFEGKIINQNNEGIQDIQVKVAYYKEGSYGGFLPSQSSDYKEPGIGYTDANGNFKLYVYSATNESEIIVIVNEDKRYGYQEKKLLNIQDENFIDYKLNLNTTTLYKSDNLVTLRVTFERTSSSNNLSIKNVQLIGESTFYEGYFNPINNYQNYNSIFNYVVAKNQNIIIQYDLYDFLTNTTSTQVRNIIIENTNIEEIIAY
ncbi:MAG: hypothetical protein HC854_17800 [Flavobacterium sp.]|nr:hypothetical protein [Flavobacterium sp.]